SRYFYLSSFIHILFSIPLCHPQSTLFPYTTLFRSGYLRITIREIRGNDWGSAGILPAQQRGRDARVTAAGMAALRRAYLPGARSRVVSQVPFVGWAGSDGGVDQDCELKLKNSIMSSAAASRAVSGATLKRTSIRRRIEV